MTGFDAISSGLTAALSAVATDPPAGTPNPSAMTDIHDIKPVLDLGADWPWGMILAGGALALLLLALAWWLWKRRQGSERPGAVVVPVMAPDQEAFTALDALAAETGLSPRQFYFRLSAILRRYVERRYHFPAAEMTTEELMPQVDRLPLEGRLAAAFKAFCREADSIKFAGAAARIERVKESLVFCRDFVRRTTQMEEDEPT